MSWNGNRRGGKRIYHDRKKSKTLFSSKGVETRTIQDKREAIKLADVIDEAFGFPRSNSGKKKVGWLVNIKPTSIEDDDVPEGRAGVDCYFIEDDGGTFKATLKYNPYFLVAARRGFETEVEEWLKRTPGGGVVKSVKRIEKEDLKMPNHLLGHKRTFLEVRFCNVGDLLAARKDIMPIVERNKKSINSLDIYAEAMRYSPKD